MIEISPQTAALVDALAQKAHRPFSHPHELALLIELAHRGDKLHVLDELSFFAKFAHKTYGIMQRIGAEAEGYDKLSKEFADAVEKSKSLLLTLLENAERGTQEQFRRNVFGMSPAALQNLLALLHDLSWYKNYLIDSKRTTPPRDSPSPPEQI